MAVCVFCKDSINTKVCYNNTCECNECNRLIMPSHMYCARKNGFIIKFDKKNKIYKYHINQPKFEKVNFNNLGYDFTSSDDDY